MFGHNNDNLLFYGRPYHLCKTVLAKYYTCANIITVHNAAILQRNCLIEKLIVLKLSSCSECCTLSSG